MELRPSFSVLIATVLVMQRTCYTQIHDFSQEDTIETDRLTKLPGHMKPLGFAGPFFDLYTMEGFPNTRDFFNKYVIPSTPLLMKNAAKISPAFTKWTDDYFLHHPDSDEIYVHVESRKKENRNAAGSFMTFREYVTVYNASDMYMVSGLPKHIRDDVILPTMLQCDPVVENILDVITWFSSGGTRSVLHYDGVDNVNCLYRGNKTLVFLNPYDDPDMYERLIDRPIGGYSSLDVDAVNFTEFPDLARFRYSRIDMTAGDCLYIPFRWYHQVNSFGSNLAVNLWWDHKTSKFLDLDDERCGDFTGRNTIAHLSWPGLTGLGSDVDLGKIYRERLAKQKEKDEPTNHFTETKESEKYSPRDSSNFDDNGISNISSSEPENIREVISNSAATSPYDSNGFRLVDTIYIAVTKHRKPAYMSGVKRFLLKDIPTATDIWDERCQDALVKYFGILDENKDSVITAEDAKLFYAAGQQTLNLKYETAESLLEDLRMHLSSASVGEYRELVFTLVERGEIDKEQFNTIFGNMYGNMNHEDAKDEL